MGEGNSLARAIRVVNGEVEVLAWREGRQALDIDAVVGTEFVVVSRVGEGKREHALLLEVGLVNAGKAADDDGQAAEEAGFESCVLARRALAVVVVTNDDPADAVVTIVLGNCGDGAELAGLLVANLVGLAVLDVDRANEHVLRDVLKVTAVLEPWPACRDVIGRALAQNLDQNREVLSVLAIPRLEGLEQLETVGGGCDGNVDRRAILGRSLEGVLARVVAAGRKLVARRVAEFELLAICALQRIRDRVEVETTGKDHGGDEIRAGDEGMRCRVSVVAASKVAVVRGDDAVLGALLDVLTVPLANARSARVSEDETANGLKGVDNAVARDGCAHLLRAGGDSELCRDVETVLLRLTSNARGARHVLVRRVGAGTDEADLEFLGPAVLLDLCSKLGERGGEVRSEWAVDVGLELIEIDLDVLVVLGAFVWREIVLECLCVIGDSTALGSVEVVGHAVVVREDRGSRANLCTHVADGAHARARQRLDAGARVLDDRTSATLDGKDACDLEDDVCLRGKQKCKQIRQFLRAKVTAIRPETDLSGLSNQRACP